jgi:hypothetical protein
MRNYLLIAMLLATPATAADPDTLTREDRALYLKCAHVLGGSSNAMMFMGAVDLSTWSREELQLCIEPRPFAEAPPPKPVKTAAVAPEPTPESNICTRKGLRKVTTRGGKSWRCRK